MANDEENGHILSSNDEEVLASNWNICGFTSRQVLRHSITVLWLFGAFMSFCIMILISADFGLINHNSPVIITPYTQNVTSAGKIIAPCIFPRLNATFLPTDFACTENEATGYCPEDWTCELQANPRYLFCMNYNEPCDLQEVCVNVLFSLPLAMNETTPARSATPVFQSSHLTGALLLIFVCLFLSLISPIIYALYRRANGDPIEQEGPRPVSTNPLLMKLQTIGAKISHSRFSIVASSILCLFSAGIMLMICIVIGTGISPSIGDMMYIHACVATDTLYYESVAALEGWSIIFGACYIVSTLCLWVLLLMYSVKGLHHYWNAPIFLVVSILFVLVLGAFVFIDVLTLIVE